MPVLKKCMCGCDLKTGALITGRVWLVLDLLYLSSQFRAMATADITYHPEKVEMPRVPLAATLTFTIISILADISLLRGVKSKNRLFLLPWLVITMIVIVSCFGTTFFLTVVLSESGTDGGIVAAVMILGFVITGFILYIWLCILSFFQELCEEGDDANTLTTDDSNLPPYSALHEPC